MTMPATTRSVVIERELPYPPEKIWRALTEGPLLKQWLMENDFEPAVGHKFNFRATPMPKWDGIINGEVLIVEPNKKLAYSWVALGLDSVVVFTLTPTSAGTLLRMEQSGFRPDQEAAYQGATYGWQRFLGGLEKLLAEPQSPTGEEGHHEPKHRSHDFPLDPHRLQHPDPWLHL